MPITFPQTRSRVMKVHDAEFPKKAPVMPHEKYADVPRLGISKQRVAGLSGPLEAEFAPEGLRLSELEIRQADPATPEAMTALVYNRIRSLSRSAIASPVK